MTTQEQITALKPVIEIVGTAVELRRDLDHAIYLLHFARERLAHSVVAATVNSEAVDQIDRFLKEHNR